MDDNSVTKWLAIDSSSNAIESENDRLATDSRHSNDSLSQSQINEHLNNNYLPELSNSGGDSSYNNNNNLEQNNNIPTKINLEQNNNIPTSSSSTIYPLIYLLLEAYYLLPLFILLNYQIQEVIH